MKKNNLIKNPDRFYLYLSYMLCASGVGSIVSKHAKGMGIYSMMSHEGVLAVVTGFVFLIIATVQFLSYVIAIRKVMTNSNKLNLTICLIFQYLFVIMMTITLFLLYGVTVKVIILFEIIIFIALVRNDIKYTSRI
jgi:hypothetical protein